MIKPVSEIKVGLDFGMAVQHVGRLAIRNGVIYFQYDDNFLDAGIEISPFRLPLKRGLSELPLHPFDGLAGVFSDSLPDGWGRLLFDRMIRTFGLMPSDVSPLDRLAHVGMHGMGALVYEPDNSPEVPQDKVDLDLLAVQTEKVLEGSSEEVITELLALNGSSAGARPKALIGVDSERKNILYGAQNLDENFEHWLVKFSNSQDGPDSGAIEYVYALMAAEAGISMPDVHLFSSQNGNGYFGVKRFDRDGNRRLHMHTVSGLLHSNFRLPSLDYEDLLNLTATLTKDIREVEKMYRLAVFNVMAHNRDDHAKNFSFLMDENGNWKLSPAYDLTFSAGPGGEQSTMILGEGKNVTTKHLVKLGKEAKLSIEFIENVIEQTTSAISKWSRLSKDFGVNKSNRELIGRLIKTF
ncbi:type II toxin-antitoxin system HipA family toxin [Chryseobacterium indologenes]|uniref:type II toxin-antitoxin system HipA family toxin n=2 Tax=Chryseobacterium group TaxID=2782232 RepID=UPI000F4E21D8|nr:type II toxin-antitoxin system HipA family toxin [Chryseobacterium indologenes]AZB32346.1 type II toxin-antitoxin system HipA family toxin [Chryseobacterium bernardetii]TLX26368.1 type II toxin-antitoxin system HipA family toxin [Chryseobacterium indologenes]